MLSLAQARVAWSRHQQLGAQVDFKDVPGGWSRTLGGVSAILALFARCPDLTRASLEEALVQGALWVSPGVRGCVWLVPRADVSLAMTVGHAWYYKRTSREMEKLGVSQDELDALGEAILALLARGVCSPEALRAELPEGSWRSLGAEGKKRGHTTTLPAALRYLEGKGLIRRIQDGGRLDTMRYNWGLSEENTLELGERSEDSAEQDAMLAQRFLEWSAPATAQELIDWSLMGKRAAKAALQAVGAVEVEVEGMGTAYALPDQIDGLEASGADDAVHLLPTLDNIFAHRSPISPLAGSAYQDLQLLGMGRGTVPFAKVKWLFNRPIVHRGELVGFWEWDPDEGEVVTSTLTGLPDGTEAAASRMATFIAEELEGSARIYSQDSLKKQRARVKWTRALG